MFGHVQNQKYGAKMVGRFFKEYRSFSDC